jgi:hypothetical protein
VARRKTQFQLLRDEAKERGFFVSRWSPGDGITRYRFFPLPVDPHQNYFAPANPSCTALGLKAAFGYVYTGRCARGRWRGALRGLGQRPGGELSSRRRKGSGSPAQRAARARFSECSAKVGKGVSPQRRRKLMSSCLLNR